MENMEGKERKKKERENENKIKWIMKKKKKHCWFIEYAPPRPFPVLCIYTIKYK